MNRWLFALSLVALGFASPAHGQGGKVRKEAEQPKQLVPAQVTPEMWIYSQEVRRYDDPQQAVRRKAELKASQRAERLAAMKWFGFSNARPQANPVPFMSVYSPTWVGNGYDRYDWMGGSAPRTTILLQNFELNR
ncbi:MAG TPA: hypothetical protein VMP01_17820 [Pirellulaceae bacterium]|nr:hypothetical protein [Pirellulaceae bacterium]